MQTVARMLEERVGTQRTWSSWRGGAGDELLGESPHSPRLGIQFGSRPSSQRDSVCEHGVPDGFTGVKEEDDEDSLNSNDVTQLRSLTLGRGRAVSAPEAKLSH